MKSIVVGTRDYQSLLEPFGEVTHYKPELMNSLNEYDTVMFTGGADVTPKFYGEDRIHPKTRYNTFRDNLEMDMFTYCKRRGMNFIGICRGAQLLCVANGDTLIQHTTGHTNKTHKIVTNSGKIIETVGDHHQMMRPYNGELLAHAIDFSFTYENGKEKQSPFFNKQRRIVEPEVVWYEVSKSLCVQFHPEWAEENHESRTYFNELIEEFYL